MLMKHKTTHLLFLFIPLFLSLCATSCVSKKAHLETLAAHDRQLAGLNAQLDSTAKFIYRLELELAERRGENAALLATQDKLQDRIASLRDEADQLRKESASAVGNLDERIKQKNEVIAARQAKIDALLATVEQRNAAMNQLALDLRDTLRQVDASVYDLEAADGRISLSFKSDFFFSPGVTNRLSTASQQVLGYVAQVLSIYPALEIQVIGHTDNAPLRRTSIQDKWEFSALRAASVVQLLTKRFELSPSRVAAVGKGDFSPRASNATPEGRARNERIELLIYPSQERLLRDLKRALD
jgi:chemotaxis protein MotB